MNRFMTHFFKFTCFINRVYIGIREDGRKVFEVKRRGGNRSSCSLRDRITADSDLSI